MEFQKVHDALEGRACPITLGNLSQPALQPLGVAVHEPRDGLTGRQRSLRAAVFAPVWLFYAFPKRS